MLPRSSSSYIIQSSRISKQHVVACKWKGEMESVGGFFFIIFDFISLMCFNPLMCSVIEDEALPTTFTVLRLASSISAPLCANLSGCRSDVYARARVFLFFNKCAGSSDGGSSGIVWCRIKSITWRLIKEIGIDMWCQISMASNKYYTVSNGTILAAAAAVEMTTAKNYHHECSGVCYVEFFRNRFHVYWRERFICHTRSYTTSCCCCCCWWCYAGNDKSEFNVQLISKKSHEFCSNLPGYVCLVSIEAGHWHTLYVWNERWQTAVQFYFD